MCADGMDRSGLPITDNNAVRNVAADLDRSARLARWFGLGLVSIGVLAMIGSAVTTLYMSTQVRSLVQQAVAEQEKVKEDAEREAVVIGDIMTCILGQFSEHRHATRAAYELNARQHGHLPPPKVGAPPTEQPHEVVEAACSRSLNSLKTPPPLQPRREETPGG